MSRKPAKSRKYLAWAKTQLGQCCVCMAKPGVELHHFGDAGMGQKGSDYLVCRACTDCHRYIQGKRYIAFERLGDSHIWARIMADGLGLLSGYAANLEARGSDGRGETW